MTQHSKKLKNECLKLFLEGKTLKEIAELKSVPFGTLQSWHKRNNWKIENKQTALKTTEKLTDLVAEENAKEIFDVRKKVIENSNRLEKLIKAMFGEHVDGEQEFKFQVSLNPVHITMVMNTLRCYLFDMAKLDGLIVDKSKNETDVNIAYAITKILTYRRKGIYSDNPHLRILPTDRKAN